MMNEHAPESIISLLQRYIATWLAYFIFGVGAVVLMTICFPLLRLLSQNEIQRQYQSRHLVSGAFRLFISFLTNTGIMNFNADDLSNLNRQKGIVLVANHPTLLDYVFIASQLTNIDCIVRASLLKNPFLHGIITACGYILNDDSDRVMQQCQDHLKRGDAILIFPEGTRTTPGTKPKLHRGAAQIALRCNVPAVALHIECTEHWLGKTIPWYSVPERRPSVRLSVRCRLGPETFLKHDRSFALAARDLTNIIAQELLLTANKEKY